MNKQSITSMNGNNEINELIYPNVNDKSKYHALRVFAMLKPGKKIHFLK